MNPPRIALIEIGGSHDECLLTQMHALKTHGKQVLLVTTQAVVDRNPIFQEYVEEFFVVDMSKSAAKSSIKSIWRKLKSDGVPMAIFNTAQGKQVRKVCLKALFHPVEFVGIVHTTRMFTESFTQKIIHWKIKKYLMPSAFLVSSVNPPKGIQLDYFYPLRFPKNANMLEERGKTVAIIGGVEERRKDLSGFLGMLQAVRTEDVRFVFLGKSDRTKTEVQSFLKTLEAENLSDKVVTFDAFVSQEVFDHWLQNATLILPLVHPETPSADQYFRNQISGAMTVSFGYKIPLLLHEAYQHIEEMQPAAFYYQLSSFHVALNKALEEAAATKKNMEAHPSFQCEEQEQRYFEFIEV